MEPKDQRRERRWNLRIHLRVFDEEHDLLLGHAVDIATKGMQVISEEAISIERTYKLSLEVILPSGTRSDTGVKCLEPPQSHGAVSDRFSHFPDVPQSPRQHSTAHRLFTSV